jgi:hypothetical protein
VLAAGAMLFIAFDGAQAHGGRGYNPRPPLHGPGSSHNPIIYHPVHGPGSSHNPIIVGCPNRYGGGRCQ